MGALYNHAFSYTFPDALREEIQSLLASLELDPYKETELTRKTVGDLIFPLLPSSLLSAMEALNQGEDIELIFFGNLPKNYGFIPENKRFKVIS